MGKITLEAGRTKNGEGRVVFMEGELLEALRFQLFIRTSNYPDIDLVFFNHKTGAKIGSFRKAWATACKEAKLIGRIFHDFRRTAVRNMVRAGIPERVAMMISGNKTRNVFERYNIVNEDDLRKASRKVTDYHSTNEAAQDVTGNGYHLVTIGEKGASGRTLQ